RCCPLPTKPGVTCSVGDRQAALLGLKLRLQPLLDVEKMSAPLLLQDKMALAERYVAGFPDLQRRLLALLDSWCQPSFDIRVVARQLPQVTPLRPERLSPGVLSRQVLSLLERQGLDPGSVPLALQCGPRFPSGLLGAERRGSSAPESPAGQLCVDSGPHHKGTPCAGSGCSRGRHSRGGSLEDQVPSCPVASIPSALPGFKDSRPREQGAAAGWLDSGMG
ncbi:unnamed protein product, partial [Gulo gulo]